MAQRNRKVAKRGNDYHATEQVDDNILPNASELAKYKSIDPDLIDFLKERAKIEQEQRHKFNNEVITLNKREQRLHHGLNYAALICGLIVIVLAMGLSYLLITKEQILVGTIFGGIGIGYVAYLFISVINKSVQQQSKN